MNRSSSLSFKTTGRRRPPSFVMALLAATLLYSAAPVEKAGAATPPSAEILELMQEHSLRPPSPAEMESPARDALLQTEEGLSEYLRSVDEYAAWIPLERLDQRRELNLKAPGSVGMDVVQTRKGRLLCVPYAGSPAAEAGIRYGDELIAADGHDLQGKSVEEAALYIRGDIGSTVPVQLRRTGQDGVLQYELRRDKIIPPLLAREDDGKTVRLRMFQFTPLLEERMRAQLEKLKGEKPQKVILDMRGNSGGDLKAAVSCAAMFLPKNSVILHLRTKTEVQIIRAEEDGIAADWPKKLIIWQDGFTASSAEMFIAALSAANRAEVWGTPSAGKAAVQQLFRLDAGGFVKLTTEQLLFPHENFGWQSTGLNPDEFMPAERQNPLFLLKTTEVYR